MTQESHSDHPDDPVLQLVGQIFLEVILLLLRRSLYRRVQGFCLVDVAFLRRRAAVDYLEVSRLRG